MHGRTASMGARRWMLVVCIALVTAACAEPPPWWARDVSAPIDGGFVPEDTSPRESGPIPGKEDDCAATPPPQEFDNACTGRSDAGVDAGVDGGPLVWLAPRAAGDATVAPPRLLAPLSVTRVTSHRPTLRWELPAGVTGAEVEVCRDRACRQVLRRWGVDGASTRPDAALPPGVWFWHAFGRRAGVAGAAPSATWEFRVGWRDAPHDTSYGTLRDFDGDGYDDVFVSNPDERDERDGGFDASTERYGRVWIYPGGPCGIERTPRFELSVGGALVFGALLQLGDFNGDGLADLVVGEVNLREARLFIYYGRVVGAPVAPDLVIPTYEMTRLGLSDMGVGDFDGDGFSDLAIFAGFAMGFVPGGPEGLRPERLRINTARVVVGSVQGVGDLDGDGYADVITRSNPTRAVPGGSSGFLWVDWPIRSNEAMTESAGDGNVAGIGDINGDGRGDAIVDMHPYDDTRAGLVYGASRSGALTVQPVPSRTETHGIERWLRRLATGGDLDGDGWPEFAIGLPCTGPRDVCPVAGCQGGGQVLVFSAPAGAAPRVTQRIVHPYHRPPDYFGRTVECVGDVNGDGFDDLATAQSPTTGQSGGPTLEVYWGHVTGVSLTPDQVRRLGTSLSVGLDLR